jgi:pimeloyl-ACP methyl ester carboxylesterase
MRKFELKQQMELLQARGLKLPRLKSGWTMYEPLWMPWGCRVPPCWVTRGGVQCALFAATYPRRTAALITIGSYARRLKAPDYPYFVDKEEALKGIAAYAEEWGDRPSLNSDYLQSQMILWSVSGGRDLCV